ncbi:MAG: hypothetical protein EZS28_052477, partial [Streblomastix strix]
GAAFRMTARQLESLTRLSEAIAKVYLDTEIKEMHVREAFGLLKASVVHVQEKRDEFIVNAQDVGADYDNDNGNDDGSGSGKGDDHQQGNKKSDFGQDSFDEDDDEDKKGKKKIQRK